MHPKILSTKGKARASPPRPTATEREQFTIRPLFGASRASADGGKADWHVSADPKANRTPPGNWQPVLGGPARTRDQRPGQHYLLSRQPTLNLHTPPDRPAFQENPLPPAPRLAKAPPCPNGTPL